jgi:hypothetical protein
MSQPSQVSPMLTDVTHQKRTRSLVQSRKKWMQLSSISNRLCWISSPLCIPWLRLIPYFFSKTDFATWPMEEFGRFWHKTWATDTESRFKISLYRIDLFGSIIQIGCRQTHRTLSAFSWAGLPHLTHTYLLECLGLPMPTAYETMTCM